jgi:uncharacterized membrane protein YjgN (DUF898 family)
MSAIDVTAPAAPGLLAPVARPEAYAVRFVGTTGAYWRLLIRGAVLLAVTLGIYRFWLATEVRRFLWSNTEVLDESLEYTGTPLELLVGFLIAIALLVPIYVGFFVVALNLGPVGQFVGVLGFPVLAFLGHVAVYRARRYRLTRTVLRGVRFHQTGAAWRYAVCALFWWTLIALTLGLAYPFAQASLERLKLRHTYYGNLRGEFVGAGWRLFLRGLLMWILVMGPLVAAITYSLAIVDWDALIAAASSARDSSDFFARLGSKTEATTRAGAIAVTCVTSSFLIAAILFPAFQAVTLRWWMSGLRFGEVAIGSRLRTVHIYGGYLRFIGYSILFFIVSMVVAIIAVVLFRFSVQPSVQSDIAEIIAAVGGVGFYVAMMLGFSTIYQATAKLTLWRRGVESIELTGADALSRVTAEGAPSSAVGEGLADALNVGGF